MSAAPLLNGAQGRAVGFTLLELLLVIVVVGIIAALAMPAVTRQDDASLLLHSARSLLAGMALQEEEAVLTASIRGLQLHRRQDEAGVRVFYQWFAWSRDLARWEPVTETAGHGELRGAARAALSVDGRQVELPLLEPGGGVGSGPSAQNEPQSEPQIVFLASGESSDFELILEPASGLGVQTFVGDYGGVRLVGGEGDAR